MSSRRSRRTHAQPRYNTDEYDPESLDPQDQQTDAATDDNTNTANRNTNNNSNSSIQASPIVDQDSIEEVTRCICGSEDLKIPKNSHGEFSEIDTGFFIQCELCAVWQHGYCVGIFDEDNSPEKYWCEQCKPENHTLFIDKYGVKRSKYYPTIKIEKKSSKRKHKIINEVNNTNKTNNNIDNDNIHTSSNSNSTGETELNADGEIESDGDDEDANKHRRKRVTLNSRDYQYELMLKKALEESAKESGVQPEDVNVSSPGEIPVARETRSRKTRYGNNDGDQFELKQEDENDDADEDNDDEDEEINNEDETSNNLEITKKKIDNSNDNDNDDNNNDDDDDDNNNNSKNNSNKNNYQNNIRDFNVNTEESEFEKEKLSYNSDTSQSKHKNKKDLSRNNRTKKLRGIENNNNENENLDSGNISESRSQSQSQTHPRSKSHVQSQNSTLNTKTNTRKTKVPKREKKENRDSKISDDKPFRANIPSARINLNEMRRRIFSIMEFVSNIQIELSNEEEFKNSLLRLDTNSFSDDIKDSQNQLVSCYNDSVIKLDSLTKKLNDWENQYH